MKSISIIILFLAVVQNALSCEATVPSQMNLAISTDYQQKMYYDAKQVLREAPYTHIHGCNMTAAKRSFIMIALGIENLVLTNRTQTYSVADSVKGHSCSIKNSQLSNPIGFKEQKEEVDLKRDFINKCVIVQVTDLSTKGVQFPKEQIGCTVERISKNAANFSGKFCYFQPSFDSNINVQLDVKSECLKEEGLSNLGITAKDFNGILNFYTSSSADGLNNDLAAIGSSDVRYSINPIEKLTAPADDYGILRPNFNANWKAKEVHLGELTIKSKRRHDIINLPFVVDTRCERKCDKGLCSSACDYAQPIVAEFTLEEKTKNGYEYVLSWYDGAVAPGQWQGILHGIGFQLQKNVLTVGNKYRITAKFREPNLDFKYFNGDVEKRITMESNNIGGIDRNSGDINQIPQIGLIDTTDLLPQIGLIQRLRFDAQLDGVSVALRTFRSYLNNKFWPPVYDNVCVGSHCAKNGKNFQNLSISFELGEPAGRRKPYSIKNVSLKKNSISGESYSIQNVENFPSIECAK